ncbi:MAG: nitrogenase iron-molybdenum cofactor biosynthesis protein NifN [Alphaproteobacteria bacterium]|nr:nitrogenase iron-molybdenum cofactor biosynthesis protein NifN [Alphaproteobacteria bacterium]
MARLVHTRKACAANPLKMSAPLGGAMAFMGLDGCLPLLHGSQGCTAFGLVLLVRHYREGIPFQTTAMNEVTTIMGGLDNLEQAILNIASRAKPKVIGICSTGLVETRGEDIPSDLKLIRARHPELDDTALVFAQTPDYVGGMEEGWASAVAAMIEALVTPRRARGKSQRGRINLLAGCHLTPGDLEELKDIIEAFGLSATVLPDISGSLDGHVPDQYIATTFGGTTVDDIAAMGSAGLTIAVGGHMREAAEKLNAIANVPYVVFDRLTGLGPVDHLVQTLSEYSGRPVPEKLKRSRSQLVDAMLDGHFFFGAKRVALGAEPDLMLALGTWLSEMGAELSVCVTTTPEHRLEALPASDVHVGDLDDLERMAAGCDLLITHSHGRGMAERLDIPFFRAGFPQFDRLGAQHQTMVGYRGTRDLIFSVGNLLMEHGHDHVPVAESRKLIHAAA